jgi:very-short-patch-repair endonuclease
MGSIIVLLMVAIAVFTLIAVTTALIARKRKSQGAVTDDLWPFYARKPLSPAAQVLYFRLVQALPEHIVLAQIQLTRLLGVKKGHNFQTWNNRINRMSVDFVVCQKDSSIVAVIELDDETQEKEAQQTMDAKKDKALFAAGIRILRWQAESLPDVATIHTTLLATETSSSSQQ